MIQKHKIIEKIKKISDTHHKLSILYYNYSQSLMVKCDKMNNKEFKKYLASNDIVSKLNGFEEMLK